MEFRLVRDELSSGGKPPAAWLLGSPHPDFWVTEVARWHGCHEVARLHVLPDDLGALVTLPDDIQPQTNANAVPFQKIGQLYYPADAQISPPLSDRDVSEWFEDGIAVMHPVAGLVRFQEHDAHSITDFIASPEVLSVRWNLAQSGNAPRPRLRSIILAPTHEVVESFLEESREDIGRTPLAEAPSYSKEEQEPAATRAGHALQEQFYKALEKMTGQNKRDDARNEPGSSQPEGRSGFLSRLGKWATARLAQIEAKQKREMNRLLHLLKTDPDAGLRFAPPLSSRGTRGRSDVPSDALLERDTDFSLGALGGGKAFSPWQIDIALYEKLRREYREAANRELRLQRFRRAAYIFANLLEDYAAAADALAQGRHFREAALLYRDHLNHPVKAAECFWEAGDFDSAEPLFAERGKFERLGELYAKIGRDGASRAAYRKAADYALQMNDFIKASRILVDHLDEKDQAISLLRSGWPFGEQSKECVREEFSLLANEGRHTEAATRLQELIHSCPSRRHLGPPLIEVLGSISECYPTANVRRGAADLARVETGRRINQLSANEAARVLAVMRSLAPNDRLLLRDTQRFLTSRKKQLLPAPPPRPSGEIDLKLFNVIALPDDATWLKAESFPGGYYALGITQDETLVLIRKVWLGRRIDLTWKYPFASRRFALAPAPDLSQGDQFVHIHANHPMASQSHPLSSKVGDRLLTAGSLQQSPNGCLGLAFSPSGEMWELSVDENTMVLKCYDGSDFRLLSTAHTASLFRADDTEEIRRRTAPVPMASIDGQVFFAFRSFLCRFHEGNFAWLELPDVITGLHCGVACGQPILAAALESSGVGIISCGTLWGVWEHHAPDANQCKVRFVQDGLLAVANTRMFELYRIDPKASDTKRCARESVKLPNLLGILPADEPDALVLMTSLQSHYYRMVEA